MSNQSSPRNLRTFISILLSYLLLTSQLTPVAFALNRASGRSKDTSEKQETATINSSLENASLNPPIPQPAPEPLLAPAIVATLDDGLPAATTVAPGGTINYTVNIRNNGVASPADDAANVVFSNTIDLHTTLVPGSAMAAVSDRYNAIGNVQISVPDGPTDLLGNDFNLTTGNNTGMTVTAETKSSTGCTGGCSNNVIINANGSFTYNPPIGFSGTDTFTYTAHSGASTATETVRITVAGEIWFINNNAGACAANCDGRLSNPFTSLATFNAANLGGAGQPGDNDWIFVYESTTAYTGPATLRLGQKLIGQDATASLISLTGFTQPSGTDPLPAMNSGNGTIVQITTTAAATNGISLNSANTLRGFTVGNTTGAKISGTSFGTLIVGNSASPDVTLNGTGQALNLTTGTLSVTGGFVSVTTTSSTGQGINLAGVADSDGAGAGSFSFGSTTVSGSTTQGILIGTTTADLNFGNTSVGTATANSGGTNSVSLQNNGSGTRTFGTLTIQNNTGAGQSAFLSTAGGNSVAGTTNLSGIVATGFGIDIRALATGTSASFGTTTVNKTTAGAAVNLGVSGSGNVGNVTFLSLNASNTAGDALIGTDNTGTITVTNNAGSLSATNGVALNITKAVAPLTPVDMDFANVNSSGATNGINLLNLSGTITATGGALTATGTVFNVSGGTVSVTYGGNISQANNAALLFIGGGHNGTINFNNAAALLLAGGGTGAQFDNADGSYTFTSQLSCNGGDAGVDILNGSGGTFTFGNSANITNPSGVAFNVNGGTASITYNGSIAKNNNAVATVQIVNGHTTGTITFQTNAITVGSGTGLLFSNADGTYNFSVASGNTILNGGDAGIDIVVGSGGTFNFGTGVGIVNPSGIAYNETGSTPTVTYNGSIDKTNNAQNAVNIDTKSGGTTSFNGQISASTTTANAINLTTNTGGTINFNAGGNGLDIVTTTGVGFNATGGGTVTVQGTGNTILANGSGIALNISNTTIGANDLSFQSISAGTGAGSAGVGISLVSTGSSGGLHVTGTGTAGSGGTIQHKTGADGSTTGGIGIFLNNTSDVQLAWIQLNDFDNFAIRGNTVSGFTFNNSVISGSNGNAAGASDEAAISFDGLTGSASISNDNIGNGFEFILKVLNTNGTLNRLTIDNTDFGTNNTGLGGDAVQVVAANTATVNVTVTNSSFINAREDLFNAVATQSADMDLVFRSNSLSNNHTNKVSAASNLLLFSTSNGDVTYDMSHNSVTTGATGSSIAAAKGVPDTAPFGGTMVGTINANTVGVAGVVGSGSQFTGIFVSALGSGTHTTAVTNNVVRHYNEEGIFLKSNDPLTGGNAVLNATVTGNQTLEPDSLAFAGLWIVSGSGSGTETHTINVVLGNISTAAVGGSPTGSLQNDFTAGDPANSTDVFLQESGSSSVINLSRAGSASGTAVLVVQDDNVGTPAVVASGTINLVNTLPPTPPPVAPLMVSPSSIEATAKGSLPVLTQTELDILAAAAIKRWSATGLTAKQTAALHGIQFELADLPGSYLAEVVGNRIRIDRDAGGCGWFVDATPMDDVEFGGTLTSSRRYTNATEAPAGRMDLLTAIMHEIGHRIGLSDSYSLLTQDDLMHGYLTKGERRLPSFSQALFALPGSNAHHGFLLAREDSSSDVSHEPETRDLRSEVSKAEVKGQQAEGSEQRSVPPRGSGWIAAAEGRMQKAETRKNHAATSRALTASMAGETVTANIGTLPAGSSVTITYQVTVNNPPNLSLLSPPRVENQGTVTANGGINVLTDDPTVVGPADKTVTLINLFDTTTSLASNINPSSQNEEVTFTATINETPTQASADPSGTVDFIDTSNGNAVICDNVAVTPGSAQCLTSTLTAGTHNIRADYSGDGNFDPSQSNIVAQVVNACATNPIVTSTADSGAGTLREALANVCTGNTITFDLAGAGPHTITLTTGELAVTKNVTINNNSGESITISGNNASRVFNINSGTTVSISGLTITGGSEPADAGGGIKNSGTLTLSSCNVYGNTAGNGGGISNQGSLTVNNCNIGGTLAGQPNTTTVGSGGGIQNVLGTLIIKNSSISGNATSTGGGGGGISNEFNGVLTIVNSTIANNSAVDNGGGIISIAAVTVINSTISGNRSDLNGGGIHTIGVATSLTLINSTITNNRANFDDDPLGGAGGISTVQSTVILHNTIVAGNFRGPGSTRDDGTGTLDGTSSFNLIGDGDGFIGITNGSNGNQVGTGASPIDPQLGALASNGGTTQTHALLPTSPAIETGSNANLPADTFDLDGDANTAEPLPVDQRGTGFPRTADSSDADAVQTVDIGAFELHPSVENISDKTTAEDNALSFSFNLGDGTGALITSVTGGSSNQTLVPDANVQITGSGTTRNIQITPALNANSPSDGTATITVTVTATNGRTAVDTFVLTVTEVNDNPDAVNDSLTAINEDSGTRVIPFIDLLGNDTRGPANESGQTITVTNVNNPTGGTVLINGATVEFTPTANFVGTASFDYTITDNGTTNGVLDAKSDTATASFAVNAVNDPPSFTGGANQTVNEDAGAQTVVGWATNISAGPGESQTLTFNVSVTGTTGNLAFTSAPAVDATTGNLTYTTEANTNGTANLSVTLSDNGSNTPPNSNTSPPQTFTITVNAVNDAPTFQLGANPSVGEDAGPQTINSFAFNFQPGPATATDEAGQTLVGYTLTQTGTTGGLTFSSTPAISTSGTLTFTTSAESSGTATFNVVATDSGPGTPPNVNQSAPVSFTITVNSVNDPPVNTVPGPQSTNTDTPLTFSSGNGNLISVADVDAGTNAIQVMLTANNGTLTLSGTGGLSFTVGDGTADATMTFTGTIANINTALNGMTFTPTSGFGGAAGLTITSNDQGFSGAGGALSDTDTVAIQVATNISIQDAKVAEPSSGMVNMIFTVALKAPAPASGVTVNFTTMDQPPAMNHATAGQDYTATSGMVTFAPGEQLKTILVPVLADMPGESDETFLVVLSAPVNGTIADGTATGTILMMNQPGTLLISELRTFGPGPTNDPNDEFVELYNNTDSPITVPAGGYGLFQIGGSCNSTPILVGTIPAGTVIPARGHYLFTGSTYSLADYGGTGAAAGDASLTSDIGSNANIALFSTTDVTLISSDNRLDAVGFGIQTTSNCALLLEGTSLAPLTTNLTSLGQHSYVRDTCGKGGSLTNMGVCPSNGLPVDRNNNAGDFYFVDTNGASVGAGQRLGAAAPENLSSPRRLDATTSFFFVDATIPAALPPNRVRDFTSDPGNNSTFGTLSIRRRFQNNTGAPITRLRIRVIDVTTFSVPPPIADLRSRTSVVVGPVTINDAATCSPSPAPCTINIQGTTLEAPPAQPLGGGFNSTLAVGTISTGTPLAPGASVNMQFLLGVQQTGAFKFYITVEALP